MAQADKATKPFPGGVIGGGKPPAKKTAAVKAPAAKKAPKEKAPPREGAIVRAPSTVSKEGEAVDAFDGKSYSITKFPTVKAKDGTYGRGTVTRANLAAWRAANKGAREAAKLKKAADKQAAAEAKKAEKAVAEAEKAAKAAAALDGE